MTTGLRRLLKNRQLLAHLLDEFTSAAEISHPLSTLQSEPQLVPTFSRPGAVGDDGSLAGQRNPFFVA